MLKHLSIKNVAVIEQAEIDFEVGFSVLTGETGAGKSIIIDAINMLKGERTSKSLIRAGETKARVDGEFEIGTASANAIAEILGTDPEEQIIISREMNLDGKNTIRVNGVPVNLATLKAIGEYIINIHGQHDNTSLLSVKSHVGFLDKFGSDKIALALADYQDIHRQCCELEAELEESTTDEQEKLRRRDMLTYQIDELEEADLQPGEDEELEKRKLLMDNASRINENTSYAYDVLYGGEDGTVHDMLWSAISKLEEISDFNGEINDIYTSLTETGYLLDEKVRELRNFCDHVSFDEREAEAIEQRLETIYTLKRKYGNSIEDILDFLASAKDELDKIETSSERAAQLETLIIEAKSKRKLAADKLSKLRQKYSAELAKRVCAVLTDLNMAKVEFYVSVENCDYKENGCDNVEFMIRTNVGEDTKPLAKIASGGELSRVMLAIKNVLAGYDNDKTVIFDEIDTGVSGSAAQKIGEKLFSMSVGSQVLCITHLPQISALADNHYLIRKEVVGERTLTSIEALDKSGRIDEVARTLGGATITVITRENARQLLEEADAVKAVILSKK